MLKPKRKITSKEINRDPFLETIYTVKENFNSKKQKYIKIGISGISVILLLFFLNQNSKSNAMEAEFGLSIGMVYLEKGDIQNAMLQFQQIIDEYSNTAAGYSSSFYIGKIHFDKDEHDLALPYFEKSISRKNNDFINSSAYHALAEIYLKNNQFDKAIESQKKSINYINSSLGVAISRLKLGKLYLLNGDKDIAKNLLEEVSSEYSSNIDIKNEISYLSGLILSLEVD